MRLLRNIVLLIGLSAVLPVQSAPVSARAFEPDELGAILKPVDEAIARSETYLDVRRKRIAVLKDRLASEPVNAECYAICRSLAEEYEPYVNDSSILYLEEALTYVGKCRDEGSWSDAKARDEESICRSTIATRCAATGIYEGAQFFLDPNAEAPKDPTALVAYYNAWFTYYYEVGNSCYIADVRKVAHEKAGEYGRLLMDVIPHDDPNYFMYRERERLQAGDFDASMKINDEWLKHCSKGGRDYAMATFFRYLEFKQRNDTVNMLRWLCDAAQTDIRNGVADQGAMWELANLMMGMNQIGRSYYYIDYTTQCARTFSSRMRFTQISPLLSDIARNYRQDNQKHLDRSYLMLGIISFLALMLIISLFYVIRQRNKVTRLSAELSLSNAKLVESNQELGVFNTRLESLNSQLLQLNQRLKENNRNKEIHIGRFAVLCSNYIDKMDQSRLKIRKLLMSKNEQAILDMANRETWKNQEISELYRNFDESFLQLFPTFVEEFNGLLREDARIVTEGPMQLTPTLRIYAMIRLGIEESGRIATFLHYSQSTVYNYRSRIKDQALGDREQFEDQVKHLCS